MKFLKKLDDVDIQDIAKKLKNNFEIYFNSNMNERIDLM
jgi:hypothetical protein